MDRSDFVQRGEVKVDFLKFYRLVSRWTCKQYSISISDLELLFYLDPIKYFTLEDFRDGTLYYHWDRQRFYRLQEYIKYLLEKSKYLKTQDVARLQNESSTLIKCIAQQYLSLTKKSYEQ